jgi:hypothetical protein
MKLKLPTHLSALVSQQVTNKYHQIFILWNWRGKKEPDVTNLSSNMMTGS